MSTVHQLYYTHCTYGSSALERREDESASEAFGYSARAGSLEGDELRRCYDLIKRHLSYSLPHDTPTDQRLSLTAAAAPRRLLFFPSTDGLQVIAQVCHRPRDVESRGSDYFAHVLFRDENDPGPRWNALDCLRLWRARGWVQEDSPDIAFRLPTLESLDAMLQGDRAAVDDDVFRSFLTTPSDGPFDDPCSVIPLRWRQMDPRRRAAQFTHLFDRLLEISGSRRKSLLTLVEPSVAALLFHGMARLLPEGGLRDDLSASTYEPNGDHVKTTLAGVWFHDPRKADLDHLPATCVNTFREFLGDGRPPHSTYSETMAVLLIEQGWKAINWRLKAAGRLHATSSEDLGRMAAIERLADTLFCSPDEIDDFSWRDRPMDVAYLRELVARKLVALGEPSVGLQSLLGTSAQLLLLELVGGETRIVAIRQSVAFLLENLAVDQIADLAALESIGDQDKLDALLRHVSLHAALPPGCEGLWRSESVPDAERLLPRLLTELDEDILLDFYGAVADSGETDIERFTTNIESRAASFLAALITACTKPDVDSARLTRVVEAADERALIDLSRGHGPAIFHDYPPQEPALGGKLHAILHDLATPEHVDEFRDRLDLILAAMAHLPNDEDRDTASAWETCRRAVLDMGRLQDERSRLLHGRDLRTIEANLQQMVEAASRAMPPETFDEDETGDDGRLLMQRIGKNLLEGRDLLPSRKRWEYRALWEKVAAYFVAGQWPLAPLRHMAHGRPRTHPAWFAAAAVAVVAVGLSAMLLPGLLSNGDKRPPVDSDRKAAANQHDQESAPAPLPPEPSVTPQEPEPEPEIEPKAEPEQPSPASDPPDSQPPEQEDGPAEVGEEPDDPAPLAAARQAGLFQVEIEPARGLIPPAAAEVFPVVATVGGKRLSPRFGEVYVASCVLALTNEEADTTHTVHLADLGIERRTDVYKNQTTATLEFRIRPRWTTDAQPVYVSDQYRLGPIEAGKRYTVRLELDQKTIDTLRAGIADR